MSDKIEKMARGYGRVARDAFRAGAEFAMKVQLKELPEETGDLVDLRAGLRQEQEECLDRGERLNAMRQVHEREREECEQELAEATARAEEAQTQATNLSVRLAEERETLALVQATNLHAEREMARFADEARLLRALTDKTGARLHAITTVLAGTLATRNDDVAYHLDIPTYLSALESVVESVIQKTEPEESP